MAINPKIKQKAEDIRSKIFGSEVRESLASGIEAISEDVEATIGRQDYVEEQFQDVLDETTGKDVISAPELIAARNGKSNLKTRLDDEHAQVTAQLQQTEQSLSSQLAHIDNIKVGGGVKMEPEDASQRMLDLLNGGTIEINSIPQDKSVTPIKTTFIKKSTNLFNRGRLVSGYALGQSDGNPTPNTNWSYTNNYEPIDRNTSYSIRMVSEMLDGTYARVLIYNSAHQFVAQSPLSTASNGVAETVINGGDNYYYIRTSVYNDETIFDSLQINKGSNLLNYEPYYQEFDGNTTFPWMTTENEGWSV
ncbi:hypothetical protein [Jeotgalibaca porci]|uniref:hypothetical protein n=1 Tax=Jeotgalibaca porci TaxID=1868793 RepID=UPI0035A10D3E